MQQVAVSVADPGQTPSEHDLDFVYVRATRTIKSLCPYTYGVQVMVLETWIPIIEALAFIPVSILQSAQPPQADQHPSVL